MGSNGCGKSSLLKALGKGEIEIPEHIDTYLLDREIEASDLTALEAVMKVDDEKVRLEKEAEQLLTASPDDTEAQARLEDVYERYVIILIVSGHMHVFTYDISLSMGMKQHNVLQYLSHVPDNIMIALLCHAFAVQIFVV